jgi:hypothetical protein
MKGLKDLYLKRKMPYTIAPFMTREQLQNLNHEIDLLKQKPIKDLMILQRIEAFVISLYHLVLNIAENTKEKQYIHKLQCEYHTFYIENLDDIIYGLSLRVPGCSVEKKNFKYDGNGKLYEVNDLTYIDYKNNLYIVVDWS